MQHVTFLRARRRFLGVCLFVNPIYLLPKATKKAILTHALHCICTLDRLVAKLLASHDGIRSSKLAVAALCLWDLALRRFGARIAEQRENSRAMPNAMAVAHARAEARASEATDNRSRQLLS